MVKFNYYKILMKYKVFIIISSFLFASIPDNYMVENVNNSQNFRNRDIALENLPQGLISDGIVDLRLGYNSISTSYMGTFGGVGLLDLSNDEILVNRDFYHFEDNNLPIGGNPATMTYDLGDETLIVVSGVASYYEFDGELISYGTGISWSVDSGETWIYSEQPVDELPDCSQYGQSECGLPDNHCTWNNFECFYAYSGGSQNAVIRNDWYGNKFSSNPVTVTAKNVTYDISVDVNQEYIYIASWAGMLRRIKYSDFDINNPPQNSDWELIPLPLDDYEGFYECGTAIPYSGVNTYIYNPVDPSNTGFGGNDNHKVFSVHVENDKIWVGTADGINIGNITSDDSNYPGCIEWSHFSTTMGDNLAGDWIIGVVPQERGENVSKRMWLLSRELISPPVPHGLSFSDNLGENWYIDSQFDNTIGNTNAAIVYNLYFEIVESANQNFLNMYASTNKGLSKTIITADNLNCTNFNFDECNSNSSCWWHGDEANGYCNEVWEWQKEEFSTEILNCVQTNKVYSFLRDENTGVHLVGTPNGLIYKENQDDEWSCYDIINTSSLNKEKALNIYPNPISSNQLVNFIIKTESNNGKIDIFDFSMEKVASNNFCFQEMYLEENYLKCIENNLNLTNGIYFCRLTVDGNEFWEKLMIINNE